MLSFKAEESGGARLEGGVGFGIGGVGIEGCLGIVSKENVFSKGDDDAATPKKGVRGEVHIPPGKDILSPASREAKEAGL